MIGDKLNILLICTVLLLNLWDVPANAVTQEWARTYDAAGASDEAKDIALDSSGNIYVTGWSFGAGIIAGEYMTIKYDPAGNQLWATAYDGPQANGSDGATAIAVDSSGNVYVTGYSPGLGTGLDIATVKYNSAGVQQWASRYDNVGGNDQGSDITVDSSGNVYVTGFATNGQQSLDIVTIKYSPAGVQQWVRLYDGGLSSLDAGMVIAETGGFIYIGGYCTSVGIQGKDYVVLKYSSAGIMQPGWPVKYNGTGSGDDIIRDMRVDSSGNVYVTGDSRGLANKNCVTIKYSSAGVQQWVDSYDNGMDDAGQAIVLDSAGNVYAAGYSYDLLGTKIEFLTRKLNNAGAVQWTQRYDGTVPAGYSVLVDVAVDNQSPANVYITGNSYNGSNWDYTTIMYDSAGNKQWAITYDPTGQSDEPRGIAVYDINDIYVTGYTGGDFGTVKYSQRTQSGPESGHLKWSQPPIEINPLAPTKTFCGWDEKSFNQDLLNPLGPLKVVADDFRCLGSMPVTSIHWWGSYYGWEQGGGFPPVVPTMWWIGFWSNVPAGVTTPYSYPNVLLHSFTVPAQRVQMNRVGTDQYYNYYPYDTCYEYYLPLNQEEVFKQADFNDVTFDHTYWISIVAIYPSEPPSYPWGWKTRPWHWMDDAVTFHLSYIPGLGYTNDPLAITPLTDPVFQQSVDVSFELDTDPNYIKWEQPFGGIRDWSHYEDVNSVFNTQDPMNETLVADDWKCLRRTPVTAIVWWGSYIGYDYQACIQTFTPLPVKPDRFRLTIWTDVPANDPCNQLGFSYPGKSVWQYDANNYDEVLVGNDKNPQGVAHEPVFRYSVTLPEDHWFHQPAYEATYWLSVQAVYDANQPNYLWGWTNHPYVFGDNAVQLRKGPGPDGLWKRYEVFDETGVSADMSFMLFTDPSICSKCSNYNCDDYVNFLDYATFVNNWQWTGPSGGYNNADLNCDGIVDLYDLKVLADQWLTSCP